MESIWNGLWSESFQVKARPGGRTMKVKVVERPNVMSPIPPRREIQHMNYCGQPGKSSAPAGRRGYSPGAAASSDDRLLAPGE